MAWQFTPYALPVIISAVVAFFVGLIAWRRRPAPGATPLTLLIGVVIYWSFWNALELCALNKATKVFSVRMAYLGIVWVMLLWLVFVLEYTNRSYWVTRKSLFWLSVIPVAFLLLLWTNEAHGWVWREIRLESDGPILTLTTSKGIAYWIYAVYGYGLLAAGAILLWRAMQRSPDMHRGQFIALLVAILAPWVSNAMFILGISPIPDVDLTASVFCIGGAALAWGAFRYQLLDIVPVARNAVIEGMLDSVVVLDRHNRVVDLNPAARQLLDVTPAQVIGRPGVELFARWPHLVAQYRDLPEVRTQVAVDGVEGRRYFDLSISSLSDSRGRPTGHLIVLHDATEMVQAKEAAEAATQAKSAFLATISHELRTPLTSVLGFAKISKRRLEEVIFPAVTVDGRKVERAIQQVGSNMDIIVSEGERLTKLVNDVLDLTKIEAGKVDWHMGSVSVPEVIEQSVAVTAALFREKPLDLALDLAEALPPVWGDHDRLVQVVVNLLSNAVKFTDEGTVTCRARQVGDELVVSVIDTGVGVDPDDHDKVFEQFVQVGDTLTGKPRGTGLGLPICKNIVEHHAGRIWVESDGQPGQGANFSFSLPVSK